METLAVARDGGLDGRIDPSAARRSGAMMGASVAIVAVAAALGFGPILAHGLAAPAPGLGASFVLAGIPAAAIAGWIMGPRSRREGFVGAGLSTAILTTALADAMIVVAWLTPTVASGGPSTTPIGTALVGAFVLWGLGLVFVGIPMLFITVPCALVWTVLTRPRADAAAERERNR
jgi:hypothetical protein